MKNIGKFAYLIGPAMAAILVYVGIWFVLGNTNISSCESSERALILFMWVILSVFLIFIIKSETDKL
jgi:hypothetical protein